MNNEPAFPFRVENPGQEPIKGFGATQVAAGKYQAWPGMTLRDYFAAAALQGMCANAEVVERMRYTAHAENIDPQVLLATAAFGAADAMLQERVK